jgi:hypothetical protein
MFGSTTQSRCNFAAAALLLYLAATVTAGTTMAQVRGGSRVTGQSATGPAFSSSVGQSQIPGQIPGPIPGLDDNRVQMVVAQQDLAKTLEILSEQTQLKFTMSKGLKGTTSRLRIDGTGRLAIDAVASQVGAVWWWNGSEVRLAARNDIVSHSVKARDIEYTISSARALGLPMELLAISKPSGRQNVKVSGPAGLVADFEALNEEISGRLSNVSVTKFGRRRVVKVE